MAIAKMEEVAVQTARKEIETALEIQHVESFNQAFRDEAFEFRGRLRAVTSISRSLNSKLIEGYMVVEEKKYWRVWGHDSFAAYLASDEVPEFSKTQYYKLKTLLEAEGPVVFDFFSDRKISANTRKLLAANAANVEFDGEMVRIGDFEAPASDRTAIIQICEAYNGAFQILRDENSKLAKSNESEKEKNRIGVQEIEKCQREIDRLNEASPFQKAFSSLMNAFLRLGDEVAKLPEAERTERSSEDMKLFSQLHFHLEDAYGGVRRPLSRQHLELEAKVAAMKPVEEMTEAEKKETFMDRSMARLAAEGFDDLD